MASKTTDSKPAAAKKAPAKKAEAKAPKGIADAKLAALRVKFRATGRDKFEQDKIIWEALKGGATKAQICTLWNPERPAVNSRVRDLQANGGPNTKDKGRQVNPADVDKAEEGTVKGRLAQRIAKGDEPKAEAKPEPKAKPAAAKPAAAKPAAEAPAEVAKPAPAVAPVEAPKPPAAA